VGVNASPAIRHTYPCQPHCGEREGPAAMRREGEGLRPRHSIVSRNSGAPYSAEISPKDTRSFVAKGQPFLFCALGVEREEACQYFVAHRLGPAVAPRLLAPASVLGLVILPFEFEFAGRADVGPAIDIEHGAIASCSRRSSLIAFDRSLGS
jgi:hypothetical protein